MIVFDATMMLLLMRPDVNAPIDSSTGLPVTHVEARIKALIDQVEKEKTKIIVPTPALSELLVRAGSSTIPSLVNEIQKSPIFRIEAFDALAAIEVALMMGQAIISGDKRGGVDCTWAKVKFDRQIIAIAKVHRATAIYSDDSDIHTHGEAANIKVIKLADLPIPTEMLQEQLKFSEIKECHVEAIADPKQETLDHEK